MRGSRQSEAGGWGVWGGGWGLGGATLTFKLVRVETREDPNTTISIYMTFRRRADDGPTLKAVLVAL